MDSQISIGHDIQAVDHEYCLVQESDILLWCHKSAFLGAALSLPPMDLPAETFHFVFMTAFLLRFLGVIFGVVALRCRQTMYISCEASLFFIAPQALDAERTFV